MALCLGDPRARLLHDARSLRRRRRLRHRAGVSQMFGELIGALAGRGLAAVGPPAARPPRRARPRPRHADGGHSARRRDARRNFAARSSVHLVETSPACASTPGSRRLRATPVAIAWHGALDDVPDGPLLLVANEFFDALPVRQFVRTEAAGASAWSASTSDGRARLRPPADRGTPAGTLPRRKRQEVRPRDCAGARQRSMRDDRRHASPRNGGAALIIDYGYERPGLGDTLQAVRTHAFDRSARRIPARRT